MSRSGSYGHSQHTKRQTFSILVLVLIAILVISDVDIIPLQKVSAFGLDLPDWLISLIRQIEALFIRGHKYYNFYLTELALEGFCWLAAGQYFDKMGYNAQYMEKMCFAQGMVEFDKAWPGENQRNKTDGGECVDGVDQNGNPCVDRCGDDGRDVETGELCGDAANAASGEE